jgi:hypothetical protein
MSLPGLDRAIHRLVKKVDGWIGGREGRSCPAVMWN